MNQLDDLEANVGGILDKMQGWIDGFIRLIPNIVAAAILLLIAYAIARSLEYGLRRTLQRRGRTALANVGGVMLRWAVMILGFLLAATIVLPSLKPGDLLAGMGIGSVAIGFAFKDILQNMLSGVLILLRQPFRLGDQIRVGDFEGTVEDIETRATYIKTYDGRRVVIPNSNIYTGSFIVLTAFQTRRSEYDIGIGCNDDWDEAMRVMVEAARGVEGVLADPAPETIPMGIDAYQNTIRLRWWTKSDWASVLETRGRVIKAVYQALDDAAIDMPYPTQVHLFHDQTEEHDGDRARQREGWPAGKAAKDGRAEVSRTRQAKDDEARAAQAARNPSPDVADASR